MANTLRIAPAVATLFYSVLALDFHRHDDESDTTSGFIVKLKQRTSQVVVDFVNSMKWHSSHPLNWHLHMSQLSQWDKLTIRFFPWLIGFAMDRVVVNSRFRWWFSFAVVLWTVSPVVRRAWAIGYILNDKPVSSIKHRTKSTSPFPVVQNSTLYKHRPLGPNTFCRLLLLHPSWSTEGVLTGELVDVQYGSKVYYDALSYTWGDAQPQDYVVINGQNFPVTSNCGIALRNLRQKVMGRMIWVDSICIDQQNLSEKDEQLKRMENIYVEASRTILWLGPGTGSSDQAIDYFQFGSLVSWLPGRMRNQIVDKLSSATSTTQYLDSCLQFLDNPWFRRVWTFQECVLTKRGQDELRCGSRSLEMSTVHDAFNFLVTLLAKTGGYQWNLFTSFSRLRVRNEIHKAIGRTAGKLKGKDLSQILITLQDFECTNPRDKIYGMLGIFRRAGLDSIPDPTYTKSVSRVYMEAMLAISEQEKKPRLLILCNPLQADDMKDVPTWVPNFRARSARQEMFFLNYNATSNVSASFRFSKDHRKLVTSVHIVDEIQKVSTHTIWKPEYEDGGSLKDSLTTNLTAGTEQSVSALIDWVWMISKPECRTQYPDPVQALEKSLRTLNTNGADPDQQARTILMKLMIKVIAFSDPALSRLCFEANPAESTIIAAEIERHLKDAAHIPELSTTFFAKDAPLHHLTSDPKWRAMCFIKTYPELKRLYHAIWYMMQDSAFFVTKKGYMGSGPLGLQDGHVVALIPGVEAPMALNHAGPGQYTVVGPVYVEGLMNGKYWSSLALSDAGSSSQIELL